MTFTPYQIVVPIVSLVLIVYVWNLMLRQKKTIWEALLWSVFWIGVGYVSLFPNQLSILSEITGIERNETAVMVTALGVAFFIIFYLVIRIEALEQKLTSFVRDEALRGISKDADRK